MSCEHDLIIKDGYSDTKAVKITICKKCLEIRNVLIRNMLIQDEVKKEVKKETEQSVWALKDLRIARMSALKPAADLVCQSQCGDLSKAREMVKEIAKEFEAWIYRP